MSGASMTIGGTSSFGVVTGLVVGYFYGNASYYIGSLAVATTYWGTCSFRYSRSSFFASANAVKIPAILTCIFFVTYF